MIVRLAADGVLVLAADDCGRLHLETELDPAGAAAALTGTGTGEQVDPDLALIDLAVLRSRAQLLATAPDWAQRWAAMVARAERSGTLSPDGRSVQVPIER